MSAAQKTGRAASRREEWGWIRKLPSSRWQARYPAPDGRIYMARTEDDKSLTFLTKTDARTWLAGMHTRISRGEWEPPAVVAKRRRAAAAADEARSVGFTTYARRCIEMTRTEPSGSGKRRADGTVRSYASKVDGYLIPEFGDTLVREIDIDRIKVMTTRLDQIPSPLTEVEVQRHHTTGPHRAYDDSQAGCPGRDHAGRTEHLNPQAGIGASRCRA